MACFGNLLRNAYLSKATPRPVRMLWGAPSSRHEVEFRMRNKLKAVTKFERRVFLLGVVLLVGLATLGLTGLAGAAQIGPNPTVQLVDNPTVSCESPVPRVAVRGALS